MTKPRSAIPNILACILLLWMFVFLGAGLRTATESTMTSIHHTSYFLRGIGYGMGATLCLYAALGLFRRKNYAWFLSHFVFLVVICGSMFGILESQTIRLPGAFMGGVGVVLLLISRREFFRRL